MTETTITENTEVVDDEKGVISTDTPQGAEATEVITPPVEGDTPPTDEPETFPREYVEKLRKEAADNRVKAKRADELAERLFRAEVRATGRLHDPEDLPYDAELVEDPEKLSAAIDTLLAGKPHLARRTPRGDVGQGATATAPAVSLIDMLR
ncbi:MULTISPECIES: hypothetical protein [unclassified Luteococcus]|uniref:hypothetical protein n=1 Tax=unclassified Luteococcus TaxID=2639923 RepID=UPI00313A8092